MPSTGFVGVLAIDPSTSTTLYAGTNGGVFKSTDGASSWQAVNTGLPENLAVQALAIDHTTPRTLYAGTGSGVFKSTDGGGAWSALDTGLTNTPVAGLVIDSTTPSTLYAATFGGGVFDIEQVSVCVGDCGGTDTVAINDIITLVNIALGNAPASTCAHGVPSGDEVNIALIIQAVNNALSGCPAPTPTATLITTPTPTSIATVARTNTPTLSATDTPPDAATTTATPTLTPTATPTPTSTATPIVVPPVPDALKVPEGNSAFLEGHANGTQDYICLPCPNTITTAATCPASGFAWAFFGPQATLSDNNQEQIITHFLSPNPSESGTPRATWQDSQDTSSVWAKAMATSSDPAFVAPGAIPWLLLQVAGSQAGPTGGSTLTATTFIQRLNTSGGVAPSTGCAVSTDAGNKALVPYMANYFFFKAD